MVLSTRLGVGNREVATDGEGRVRAPAVRRERIPPFAEPDQACRVLFTRV